MNAAVAMKAACAGDYFTDGKRMIEVVRETGKNVRRYEVVDIVTGAIEYLTVNELRAWKLVRHGE